MSQITLYLDDATQALVEQAALAGRFADFPLIDAASVGSLPTDPPRLAF